RDDVRDCEVEILEDVIHHHGTRITSTVERGISYVERLVDPRHVAVALHLLEVEPCAEETRDAAAIVTDEIRHCRIGVLREEVVDAAERVPAPVDVAAKGNDFILP